MNLDGTNGLNLVPAITDPNLIPDLATWWVETILLMSNYTRTGLLSEMNTLNAATSIAMPGGVEAQVVYKALMLYRQMPKILIIREIYDGRWGIISR